MLSIPGGLGGKKKTITNLCIAFSCYNSDGDTARELAILTPFIKPVGRTHGFQAGSVHVSLLRLWLFCSFDIAE